MNEAMTFSYAPTISCTHSLEMDWNSARCIECATCKSPSFWISLVALLRRSENLDDLLEGATTFLLTWLLLWFSLSYESRSATSDDDMIPPFSAFLPSWSLVLVKFTSYGGHWRIVLLAYLTSLFIIYISLIYWIYIIGEYFIFL